MIVVNGQDPGHDGLKVFARLRGMSRDMSKDMCLRCFIEEYSQEFLLAIPNG